MTPIQVALDWGRSSMVSIVQRMLENADDTLFGMAEASQSNEDRRNLFDSMRLLRKSSGAVTRDFESALYQKESRAVALDSIVLTLLDDQAVEEDIMVSRIVARIEDAAKQSLWEYATRLENVTGADNLRESFQKLRPAEIAKTFRGSLGSMEIDESTKLILFKLYERQLVSDSSTVYDGLNLRLEAAGISSKMLSRRTPPPKLPPGQPERRHPEAFVPSRVDSVAPVYRIPPDVTSLLSSGHHGADLDAMVAGPGEPGPVGAAPGPDLDGVGSQQRISLVAQLLLEKARGWQGVGSDDANQLLIPLIRIALSDPAFFSDPQHPARELLTSLGRSKGGPGSRLDDVRATLEAMATPEDVPREVLPLSAAELHRFLASQRSAEASTSARMDQARAAAYQQIRSIGSGRDLPMGVSGFLTKFWLPMVSSTHLKFGAESDEMRRATRILQRLFGECRWLPEMKDAAMIREIIDELEGGLKDMAVPDPLVTKARTVLQEGLGDQDANRRLLDLETLAERAPPSGEESAEADATAPAFPGDDAAWRAAVPVGSWFRVFDRAKNQTQWLSAGVLYPQSNHLTFTGFNPDVSLAIERQLFLEDLISGKAEAVEPTELQQSSIRLLCLEFSRAKEAAPATR